MYNIPIKKDICDEDSEDEEEDEESEDENKEEEREIEKAGDVPKSVIRIMLIVATFLVIILVVTLGLMSFDSPKFMEKFYISLGLVPSDILSNNHQVVQPQNNNIIVNNETIAKNPKKTNIKLWGW